MKLELDVWLERYDPCVILRDTGNGQVLLRWDAATVRQELARGDLCLEDLCNTGLSIAERLGLVVQAQPGRPRHLRLLSAPRVPARPARPLPARCSRTCEPPLPCPSATHAAPTRRHAPK